MAIKGKNKRRVKTNKSTLRHTRRKRIQSRRKCMRGGNYEKDVTTRTTDGIPTKQLNQIVVTVPGYPAMSGTAYKRLAEEIDRDGPDQFLK